MSSAMAAYLAKNYGDASGGAAEPAKKKRKKKKKTSAGELPVQGARGCALPAASHSLPLSAAALRHLTLLRAHSGSATALPQTLSLHAHLLSWRGSLIASTHLLLPASLADSPPFLILCARLPPRL